MVRTLGAVLLHPRRNIQSSTDDQCDIWHLPVPLHMREDTRLYCSADMNDVAAFVRLYGKVAGDLF